MSKAKIVITDHIFPDTVVEREMLEGLDAELVLAPKGADLRDYVRDADVVINTYASVGADVIAAMEKCRLVIRNGIGFDTIDVDACTAKGIMVANIPHYCSDEVATHTMMLMLAVTRKALILNKAVRSGVWDVKVSTPIFSLQGKTLGLVGFGKIPRLVAEKARAFGMQMVAFDPFVSAADMSACYVRKVDFAELAEISDVISIHCPLTKETRGLFCMDVFRKMKPTAYLINAARGPIIREQDLVEALQQGLLAGAGLDVLEENRVEIGHPLANMDNVLVTPHAAWYSEESIVRRRVQTMENVVAVLKGGQPAALCNRAALGL